MAASLEDTRSFRCGVAMFAFGRLSAWLAYDFVHECMAERNETTLILHLFLNLVETLSERPTYRREVSCRGDGV